MTAHHPGLTVFPIEEWVRGDIVDNFALTQQLRAFLTWPHNPDRRQAYLHAYEQDFGHYAVRHGQQELASFQALVTAAGPLPTKLRLQARKVMRSLKSAQKRTATNLLLPLAQEGVLKTVVDAPALDDLIRETVVAQARWVLAGRRLFLTAQLALHHDVELADKGGASTAKARALMVSDGIPRREIDEGWKDFRSVAHLAAGALQASLETNIPIADVLYKKPVLVLDRAAAFQAFAMRHRSKRSREPLLRPFSSCFIFLPGFEFRPFLRPLPPAKIAFLNAQINPPKGFGGELLDRASAARPRSTRS